MVAKAGRPEETPDSAQMHEVARLFYKENATRQQIAKSLHIDPRKVTWLLEQARALGVVRIDIRETVEGGIVSLLQGQFPKLEQVFIVPGPEITTFVQCDDFIRRAGVVAADYFEKLLDYHPRGKQFNVGVSGGARSLEFARAVRPSVRDTVHVHVTALVGRGHPGAGIRFVEPSLAATTLWMQCGGLGGHCNYITVEPYWMEELTETTAPQFFTRELDRLAGFEAAREVLCVENLHVVFGGLGYLNVGKRHETAPLLSMWYFWNFFQMESKLAEDGMIGDFCNCPFSADGNSRDDWRFFLTAGHGTEHSGIEFYKHMVDTGKKVVGIGGGPVLLPVIKAALKAGIINVLIIDEFTARQIAETT